MTTSGNNINDNDGSGNSDEQSEREAFEETYNRFIKNFTKPSEPLNDNELERDFQRLREVFNQYAFSGKRFRGHLVVDAYRALVPSGEQTDHNLELARILGSYFQ